MHFLSATAVACGLTAVASANPLGRRWVDDDSLTKTYAARSLDYDGDSMDTFAARSTEYDDDTMGAYEARSLDYDDDNSMNTYEARSPDYDYEQVAEILQRRELAEEAEVLQRRQWAEEAAQHELTVLEARDNFLQARAALESATGDFNSHLQMRANPVRDNQQQGQRGPKQQATQEQAPPQRGPKPRGRSQQRPRRRIGTLASAGKAALHNSAKDPVGMLNSVAAVGQSAASMAGVAHGIIRGGPVPAAAGMDQSAGEFPGQAGPY